MKRKNARTSCKVLFFSIAALSRAWGGDIAAAEEKSQTMANLQGLVAFAEQAGKSPVSIAFAQTAGGPQNDNDMECGTLAWGKSMLAEMEMALATREGKAIAVADDILSFRDWCLGAPGGGNLALAVSAEEVAVELMFRELAEENADDRKVRGVFRPLCAAWYDGGLLVGILGCGRHRCARRNDARQRCCRIPSLESRFRGCRRKMRRAFGPLVFPHHYPVTGGMPRHVQPLCLDVADTHARGQESVAGNVFGNARSDGKHSRRTGRVPPGCRKLC